MSSEENNDKEFKDKETNIPKEILNQENTKEENNCRGEWFKKSIRSK